MPKPTLTSAARQQSTIPTVGYRKLGLESDICERQGVYYHALSTPAWEYQARYRIPHSEAARWWGVHAAWGHVLAYVGT